MRHIRIFLSWEKFCTDFYASILLFFYSNHYIFPHRELYLICHKFIQLQIRFILHWLCKCGLEGSRLHSQIDRSLSQSIRFCDRVPNVELRHLITRKLRLADWLSSLITIERQFSVFLRKLSCTFRRSEQLPRSLSPISVVCIMHDDFVGGFYFDREMALLLHPVNEWIINSLHHA